MKKIIALIMCMFTIIGCCSCKNSKSEVETISSEVKEVDMPEKRISFFGVGDNLIHNCVYWQAEDHAGGNGYDFKPMYELVRGRISAADVAYINQETILGGAEIGLSSYPLFNSPTELGEDMIELGFDVFSHATNHVFDKGEKGIDNSYNFYLEHPEVVMTGIYKDGEDKYRILEKDGVKIAFVNYTFHTNGMSLPEDSEYSVAVAEKDDTDELIAAVKKAGSEADFVVCLIHWGDENKTEPNTFQREFAKELASAGCHAVIGTHPHTIQPVEFVDDMLVCYSLGNFISAQNKPINLIGGMISFDFVLDDGKKEIQNASFEPVINQFGAGFANIRIIPFSEYSENLAVKHGVNVSYEYFKDTIEKTINDEFLKY